MKHLASVRLSVFGCILLASLLALPTPCRAAEQMVSITFTNDARLSNHTNFPALVTFSEEIGGFDYGEFLSTNGWDLRFWTDITKSEELDYEIEKWDTNVLGTGWTPADISGCTTWLRADLGVLTNASGGVTNWLDQSGSNNHATQTTPANCPTVVANGLNGQPALAFNGGGQHFDVPEQSFSTGGNGFHAFLVTRNDDSVNGSIWLGRKSDTLQFIADRGNGNIGIRAGGASADAAAAGNTLIYHMSQYSLSGNLWQATYNGTPGTATTAAGSIFYFNSIGYYPS